MKFEICDTRTTENSKGIFGIARSKPVGMESSESKVTYVKPRFSSIEKSVIWSPADFTCARDSGQKHWVQAIEREYDKMTNTGQ